MIMTTCHCGLTLLHARPHTVVSPAHPTIPRTASLTEIHFRDILGAPCSMTTVYPTIISQRSLFTFSSTLAKLPMSCPSSSIIPPKFFPNRLHPQLQPSSTSHLRLDMQDAHSDMLLPPNWNLDVSTITLLLDTYFPLIHYLIQVSIFIRRRHRSLSCIIHLPLAERTRTTFTTDRRPLF